MHIFIYHDAVAQLINKYNVIGHNLKIALCDQELCPVEKFGQISWNIVKNIFNLAT